MRHGSLFSGIGGFDLASEWMGWENVFHCEWNEFGQKVLKYYWPKAITYHDITKTDFTIHRGTIDILTGGFPCQPYSMAGKRLGKEDERHLWPEMLRAIREIQPTWVVGENVLGLVNWNGGLVFHEVQADLEAQGYEVQPYVLPAASVNAPHRRDRVWFVAFYTKSERNAKVGKICSRQNNEPIGVCESIIKGTFINSDNKRRSPGFGEVQSQNGKVSKWDNDAKSSDSSIQSNATDSELKGSQGMHKTRIKDKQYGKDSKIWGNIAGHYKENNTENSINKDATDSDSTNSETRTQREVLGQSDREKTNGYSNVECRNKWENFPTVSPICTRDDGISDRLDGITFSKWRNESIKAGGNAIVPQVVHQIFKAIDQYNNLNN